MVDAARVAAACAAQAARQTEGIHDMAAYLAAQVSDESHREVVGPLLAGTGASGLVRHGGRTIGEWGDPTVPEMLFSATKSVVSLVAGVARLDVEARVRDTVALPGFDLGEIRWRHLLQQTSGWSGELWGKPAAADAQSQREGDEAVDGPPGSGWAYNDVRVNLLCLALTALFGRSLPSVLAEVMAPLGASDTWSWHGYRDSYLDGGQVAVVSGGAHWGGGLWMSAADLALIGQLYLRGGEPLLDSGWVAESWRPCDVRPQYGYLWWLNDGLRIMPTAPPTGRAARGNGGRHLLWVDPARDLVIVSHWGEDVGQLVAEVSAAV